jgi:hypothetical protein
VSLKFEALGRPKSESCEAFRRWKETKGRVRRYDIVVWAAKSTCRALDRRDACGARAVTASETAAACMSCGVFSTAVEGQVSTSPRDTPYDENRIILRWNKTRSRCREDHFERGSFAESIEQVPARARTTGRLRTQIGAAIVDTARSVAEVATVHGVSWPTAHRAFVAHAKALLAELEPTRVLGIDETRRGSPAGRAAS